MLLLNNILVLLPVDLWILRRIDRLLLWVLLLVLLIWWLVAYLWPINVLLAYLVATLRWQSLINSSRKTISMWNSRISLLREGNSSSSILIESTVVLWWLASRNSPHRLSTRILAHLNFLMIISESHHNVSVPILISLELRHRVFLSWLHHHLRWSLRLLLPLHLHHPGNLF